MWEINEGTPESIPGKKNKGSITYWRNSEEISEKNTWMSLGKTPQGIPLEIGKGIPGEIFNGIPGRSPEFQN